MKKIAMQMHLLLVTILFTGLSGMAQNGAATEKQTPTDLKTYVIERNIPGAGQFSPEKLKDISKTSCTVLKELGPGIQWIQSYVTDNKIFCVYKAENIELIKEHAKKGGFPVTNIYEVSTVISPSTAN
jgi:hypothetical protein